jgi:predicted Zn-dependent protease
VSTNGGSRWLALGSALTLVVGPLSSPAYPSSEKKRARAYRDINAIGHRVIGYPYGTGNWYSLDKEKELGTQVSAAFEKSIPLLRDSMTESYLDRLGQVIARNSDAQLPITILVIDSEDSYFLTLLGGHQYVTRGLLLQLQNEGELAAAIARGVAHTALRSATGELTRTNLIKLTTVTGVFVGPGGVANGTADSALGVPVTLLHFSREDESAADYFGVQYLYKSGYDPDCFIGFIQKAWPASSKTTATAFSPFPPLPERLKALERERSVKFCPSGLEPSRAQRSSRHFENTCSLSPLPSQCQRYPPYFAQTRKSSIDCRTIDDYAQNPSMSEMA